MDSIVVWVGLLSGVALIAATVVVYVRKSEMSFSGFALSVMGAILIGMSVWSDVTVSAAGANIRFYRDQSSDLGKETKSLADQVERIARHVEQVRNELASSVNELASSVETLGAVVSGLIPTTAAPEFAAGLARVEEHTFAANSIEVNLEAIAAINGRLQEIVERDVPAVGWRGFPLRP